MNAAEIMITEPATCRITDTINRAAELMWERRTGCVPVLDDAGRVVGVLTDRDVCIAAYTQGRPLHDIPVTTGMSRPALSCRAATTLEDAENLMMAHGVRRLVVLDSEDQLLGLLSLDDIALGGADWDGTGKVDLERVAITLGEITRHTAGLDGVARTPAADEAGPVENSLAVLRTLRDEIRVDLNLAGKELRDRWRRLEARLQSAELRLERVRREGERSLADLLESARSFRNRLRGGSHEPGAPTAGPGAASPAASNSPAKKERTTAQPR